MIRLRIKEIAKERKISMGKLSRMSDVSQTTIKRIFDNPYHDAGIHTLWKIAKALGLSINDVIEEEQDL